jgi:hypothetical protein
MTNVDGMETDGNLWKPYLPMPKIEIGTTTLASSSLFSLSRVVDSVLVDIKLSENAMKTNTHHS